MSEIDSLAADLLEVLLKNNQNNFKKALKEICFAFVKQDAINRKLKAELEFEKQKNVGSITE